MGCLNDEKIDYKQGKMQQVSPTQQEGKGRANYCIFSIFFFFRDRVSLNNPGCPGTHSVDQAGLKKKSEILLPLPPDSEEQMFFHVCLNSVFDEQH